MLKNIFDHELTNKAEISIRQSLNQHVYVHTIISSGGVKSKNVGLIFKNLKHT